MLLQTVNVGIHSEDAATFFKMDSEAQSAILKAYFDPQDGLGYTLCRTHINSCDFSLGNYAYDEVDGDVDLAHFSIERDHRTLIPLIRAALQVAGGPIKLFASPWSPPAWMKTNGQMNFGGKLKPEYRAAWALYYARYVRAYAEEGIPIWGVSVQNEPEATQTWDSCLYTGEEERDFVRDFLGPMLKAQGLGHLRVIIWDHNRDRMYERAKAVLDDPHAAQYVWGTGFHWYVGDNFDNVQRVHDAFPDKALLFTEGCQEGGPHLNDWSVAERYARSIINDLNRWTVGWVDWNLVLDEQGGPNHVGNYCSAPIIADTQVCSLAGVTFNPSYYAIGHFARFIRRADAGCAGSDRLPRPGRPAGRGGDEPRRRGDPLRAEVRRPGRADVRVGALDHDLPVWGVESHAKGAKKSMRSYFFNTAGR